ncbi:serine protease [Asanoa ishikariensis]|uniref:Pre-peptidase C-terminal domain-containing protein n=1 Tax=Asanoa ishikariensis TaxID=137265 RepID=A0A1H3MS10_9ACTN|nr:S8 family serine peptidase [Asanoa ishikariensis]GIF66309.1 serine protease [Asanoa ishikariensis]SDY79487.1 pre-peptidase C-terminal domain-containing protein [Asanoa ishikariensis]
MTYPQNQRRRVFAGLLATVLATGLSTLAVGTPAASADPGADGHALKQSSVDTLGAHDLELLAEAKAKRARSVMLIVATDKGESADVAAGLKKLGATVAKRVDSVGYVRASVPTNSVLNAARLPGVAAVDLDEIIPMPEPEPTAARAQIAAQAVTVGPPGADTPAANPYMPTAETGSVAFKEAHPQWDGRGVTIGIMDAGVDLDNPALQTTSTGERKIVDWFTATDPVFDGDGTWRAMVTNVAGPSFTYQGQQWTAPRAGAFKVNRFNENITAASAPGGDVNRDGDRADLFGVLYDPVSHDVWVDANQDRDFTNDGGAMRPYGENFQVGHFGTDNPATAVREQMPFVVEYREDVDATPIGGPAATDFVNIGIIEDQHGSHVAGITAANNMFGNDNLDGQAPGAKLVSARACTWGGGCSAAALTDGMVDLVVNRHVDVVNMSIGGLPSLNDGNNARGQLYQRLINDYGVQLVFSAGNSGPGVNTVGDPSVADDVISVAASISKETWLANYGSVTRTPNQLFNFSSRGPSEDGGLKPTISAPGSAISTTPLWQPGIPVADAGYPLPPGYQMINGTSMASPQTAGGVALLLSAAKATGQTVTPAALRRAVSSSAAWIDGVPAYAQGNGQLDVPGAWDLLAQGPLETRTYDVHAPVCTPLSDSLATPDKGDGIYNRCAPSEGGQRPNDKKSYTVKVTRTSGPKGDIKHAVRWVGDDGFFRNAPKNLILPLNKTATFTVETRGGEGVHSAIMQVDDPKTPVVDFEFLNTVVIANVPTKKEFRYSTSGSVDRNGYTSYFVAVPEGTKALQVNLSGIATGSQTRFIAINPWGVPAEDTGSPFCYTNFSDPNVCKPEERSYENPIPGIWELEVEARRTSPTLENPFQLTARIQGVAVDPADVELPSVAAGVATPVTWQVQNVFGPVRVSGQGGPLGSAMVSRPSIAENELQTYEVTVPAGASRLDVAIGNPSDQGADLDLTVRLNGAVVGQDADGDSEEAVSIVDPEPGVYEVEVAGYAVPAGTTEYDYRDVFYAASLGAVSAPDTVVDLVYGGSTSISGTVTAQSVPPAGRQLLGELRIVTDEGSVVGRSNVLIGAVTG